MEIDLETDPNISFTDWNLDKNSSEIPNDRVITELFFNHVPSPLSSEPLSRIRNIQPPLAHILPNEPHIAMICGMNISAKEADAHAEYLNSFFPGRTVDLIPNKSHGAALDLAEVFFLNYSGISIRTAKALQRIWLQFHKVNKENPDAKLLQFCHSQGAIHVKNALTWTPPEIQSRIIVIAIAPGTIVPQELCFASFNYASKRDLVPWAELALRSGLDSNETEMSDATKKVIENQAELILLDPHPKAKFLDHEFQSPTFKEVIRDHVEDYLERNGQYSWT
jgi:hypothetical protein